MKTYRIVAILFFVAGFSFVFSIPGYAQQKSIQSQRTIPNPQIPREVPTLQPMAPRTVEAALAGAVPVVMFSPYIKQGAVDRTMGQLVKDTMWVVGGLSSVYKTSSAKLGFRGVITRMTADSLTGAVGMSTTYTLYVNGTATRLTCQASGTGDCSANWDVPINIDDKMNIAVYLPKTQTCISSGGNVGCAGATPVITLMVRMGTQ